MSQHHRILSPVAISLAMILTAGCGDDNDGSVVPCPEGLVGFEGPEGAGCIETDETTNAEAASFLTEHGNECSGHFCIYVDEPGSRIEQQGSDFTVEAGYESHPVVQITWHGAAAYCESRGWSLCADSAWVAACAGPSGTAYPYGTSYDPEACNGMDAQTGTTAAVASLPTCEGGVGGLFDMSGNVYEWTDACAGGPCLIRGGSFDKPAEDMACDGYHTMDGPSGHREDLGVRCCAPPLP